MGAGGISVDDPGSADVRELLERHLEFANSHSPPEDVHALDAGALLHPAVTFFSCRRDGELLAVGALRQLDGDHAELKSMHTAIRARGRGIGRAMAEHLLDVARARGLRRVSLETGSMPAFAPARALYASIGFTPCGPFGVYRPSRNSTFMTLALDGVAPEPEQDWRLTASPHLPRTERRAARRAGWSPSGASQLTVPVAGDPIMLETVNLF